MRKIIHINNTYITSIDELREAMCTKFTKLDFRRDILAFYKDGVLPEWLEEESETFQFSFSPEEALSFPDNEVYDDIHNVLVGTHVREQIRSDFYNYLTLVGVEHQIKDNSFKNANSDDSKRKFTIPPKTNKIRFKLKLIKTDNNQFEFGFHDHNTIIDLQNKKKGETFDLVFDVPSHARTLQFTEGGSNCICTISVKEKDIPASIEEMLNNLRPIRSKGFSFRVTEAMINQEQYKDVMGDLPFAIEGGLKHPVYFSNVDSCYDFINKLNALTHRCFQLPQQTLWSILVDEGVKNVGYNFSSNIIQPIKMFFANQNGLYNTTNNIPEFLASGAIVLKGDRRYKIIDNIDEAKKYSQIGFRLVEFI